MFAIPALLLVLLALFWLSALGLTQARAGDLAQQAARALARGSDAATVDQMVSRVMPGATVQATSSGEWIEVAVTHRMSPPGPLLSGLGVTVRATATAMREPQVLP